MRLVKTDEYEGYYYEDILKELGNDAQKFDRWFDGQTGAIHGGKLVVFRWDYERFLAGLPVID